MADNQVEGVEAEDSPHLGKDDPENSQHLDSRRSGDSSVTGVRFHKVCCVCGTMLNHRPRFRDSSGRYWCPACNEMDHERNRPAPCADCGVEMPRRDLKELSGLLLCPVCMTKLAAEDKTVSLVRLSALAHGQGRIHTKKKPKRSFQAGMAILAIILFVIAIVVALLMTR